MKQPGKNAPPQGAFIPQLELNFNAPPAPPAEEELRALAREELNRIGCGRLASRIQVRWNTRLQTTAGLACYAKSAVLLNPRLTPFGHREIIQTLKHELAHLVAHFRAGRRRIAPHGPEWRAACRDLGVPGERRCHHLPLPRRSMPRKYFYECPSCSVAVHRVRPFRRRVACLACCRKHAAGRYDERFRLVKVS